MKNLTDSQIDKLYVMSDLHFKWFQKQNKEDIKYEDVLELNHVKMIAIIESCSNCSEEMLEFIFDSIIKDYEDMLYN